MKLIPNTGSHFDLDEESANRLLNEVLARPLFVHLATGSEQGPRESPVWFLWENGILWIIGNYETDSFPKRIEREPRCAVGIINFEVSTGLVQHVDFRGQARLEAHDPERMKRLLSRYMGESESWDLRFVKILDDADYIFIVLSPTR